MNRQRWRSAVVWPRAAWAGTADLGSLAGSTILITGASSGIGRATALLLARHGVQVLALARSGDRLADLVSEISAAGGQARAIVCDLSDPDQVRAVTDALISTPINTVISNAGRSIYRSVFRAPERHDLERSVAVNLTGPAQLLSALVPLMIDRGGGTIVNVSTVSAKPPAAPRWGSYQATKAGFDVWLGSAAAEWRSYGMTIRSVYLPLVTTPMSESGGLYSQTLALSADQAATIVGTAALRGRNRIAPWWLAWQDLAATALPGLFDAAMEHLGRRQREARPPQTDEPPRTVNKQDRS